MSNEELESSARTSAEEGLSRVERHAAPIVSALDDLMLAGQVRTLRHIQEHINNFFYQAALNRAPLAQGCSNGD